MTAYILAIDQGTTSSRAILFDAEGAPVARAQRELRQAYPRDGWVEQDPEDIWTDTLAVVRECLDRAGLAAEAVAAIGIANQRETTVLWERATGRPVHNAIVWQDRRTVELCDTLREAGHEPLVRARTGLLLDPYFSATKLRWLLDHVPDDRSRAAAGELCFGTVDSFLLFRLTGGAVHAADATNAARTMLFDLGAQRWGPDLLDLFAVPAAVLPTVMDNCADFGTTDPALFGAAIPIAGMAGDQHAALIGQACFEPGMVKSTYGTGCFALVNTGTDRVFSDHRLLTTMAYRINGRPTYALEGSVFSAGSAIQWLRDELGLLAHARDSAAMAASVPDNGGVYLVPAFTGLGAPYWDARARGAILGLTRNASAAHLVRAALEAQGYQTRDLLAAMAADMGGPPRALRVDGGLVENDWVCAFLADINGLPVERPAVTETTAQGAAYLAGLGVGVYTDLGAVAKAWRRERRFEPAMTVAERDRLYAGWTKAVGRVLHDPEGKEL
ncbi:MAG: glycerol kinase GlpK [Rhodospirillaceae bacterium]|nr:glycerol kinase GlpK [Rhodospirillaceae bacterium]MBT6119645.1 glycerol kinase GlpK [Rhodospirillaceae bacterium]